MLLTCRSVSTPSQVFVSLICKNNLPAINARRAVDVT